MTELQHNQPHHIKLSEESLQKQTTTLNLGPTHPATHGVFQIIMELSRIADHLVCNSVIAVDTGALTPFTYVFQQREKIYEIFEEICGSRLTTNIGRVGGFERNFTPASFTKLHSFLETFPKIMKEFEALLHRDRKS